MTLPKPIRGRISRSQEEIQRRRPRSVNPSQPIRGQEASAWHYWPPPALANLRYLHMCHKSLFLDLVISVVRLVSD